MKRGIAALVISGIIAIWLFIIPLIMAMVAWQLNISQLAYNFVIYLFVGLPMFVYGFKRVRGTWG